MRLSANNQYHWRQDHISRVMKDLDLTRKEYKRFLIVGNKLHRAYELSCNGYIGSESIYEGNVMVNQYTDEMYLKDTAPLYEKAEKMAKEKGLYIYFQTDPRGATIYLDKKQIKDTSYNNAYCIY